MPKSKNKFAGPNFFEETILDKEGNKIGDIRIKPASVLWKPSGDRQFYCVPLSSFTRWITSRRASASRTSS
jgi:hypothetical protein